MILAALVLQVLAIPEIRLTTSDFASQYGYIRAMRETPTAQSGPGVRTAVQDLIALDHALPSRIKTRSGAVIEAGSVGQPKVTELYWRTLDALVFSAGSREALDDVAGMLPKIGGELDTAMAIKSVEKAIDESASDFTAGILPTEKATAQRRIDDFQRIPRAKRDAAIRFILDASGVKKSPKSISILVLPEMAGKEGMTVRTPSGLLIVIGAGKYQGSDFAEVVLHEATHVFDTAAGDDSLFGKLRAALRAAKGSDFEVEQVPHVAMFLLAAEAVRREIDSKHEDVGKTFGAYSRGLQPLRKAVEPELKELIDRKISAEEAVSRIVARLPKP